jgi:hypothetical protein
MILLIITSWLPGVSEFFACGIESLTDNADCRIVEHAHRKESKNRQHPHTRSPARGHPDRYLAPKSDGNWENSCKNHDHP